MLPVREILNKICLNTKEHLVIGQFTFSLFFTGCNMGHKFTRMDRNEPNYWMGQDCTDHAKLVILSLVTFFFLVNSL